MGTQVSMELWAAVRTWTGSATVTLSGTPIEKRRTEDRAYTGIDLAQKTSTTRPLAVKWAGSSHATMAATADFRESDGQVSHTSRASGSGPAEVEIEYPSTVSGSRDHVALTLTTPELTGSMNDMSLGPHMGQGIVIELPLPQPDKNGLVRIKGTIDLYAQLEQVVRRLTGDGHLGFSEAGKLLVDYDLTADLRAVRTLDLWCNAFIPGRGNGAKPVPGRGPFAGHQMIKGPPGYDCFITDSRSFDSSPNASARIHVWVELELPTGKSDTDIVPGLTVCLDCDSGAELDRGRTRTDRVTIGKPEITDEGHKFRVKYKLAVYDPLVDGAAWIGDVDADGVILVRVGPTWDDVTVEVNGKVDAYPAFEMYARLRDRLQVGAVAALFQVSLQKDATPVALIGRANRKVHGKVTLTPP